MSRLAKTNLAILNGFQTAVGNGDAENATSKIVEDFVATAGMLGMNNPFFLPDILANLLFGVSPSDSPTFIGALLFVLLVGVLSIYWHARAGSRVDPVIVLSDE